MTATILSAPRAIDWEGVKRRIAAAIEQTEALLDSRPDVEERLLPAPDTDAMDIDDAEHISNVVSFVLSNRRFALDVRYVWEIVSVGRLSPLPGMPPYVRGIHDLRGQLLPVFDLSSLLGVSLGAPTAAWAMVCGEDQPEFLVLTDETPEVRELVHKGLAPSQDTDRAFEQAMTGDGIILLDGPLLFNDRRLFLENERPAADAVKAKDEKP
ncbi:MAG TPA: chemotaxis protein CheW [Sinorhizobium sp.]|nr:chemotaxis protein CheW [Sinorhizobium sp.]